MKKFAVAFAAVGLTCLAGAAGAQDFPSRPVTLVNPYSAGGPADLIGRTIAEGMGDILGQPVVVENRPGAGTAIAATHVAQSDPDGYTLFIGGSPSHVITPALMTTNYDGIEDFAPVSMVANVPNVLVVNASSGMETIDDLIAKAKEAPEAISFASVGVGSLPQFAAVLFQQVTGTELTHIPYGGAAPAVVDLLAGNVDMAFLNVAPLLQYIQEGQLRPLGVAASERSDQIPDVPTMEELGYEGFQMSTWYGISAPAGTPPDVIAKLDEAIAKTLQEEDVRERLTNQGVQIFYKPSSEFTDYLAADAKRMLELIDTADMRAD
ncbi:tripartite tricarboxylate transporter substrate binding protein [Chelativorans sp. AA-79]|uniref:Bug family tripartite tricarboxylate transporter substrate binding protein n=1 Tax=Chelativorans sp. AA-79 TaxID=3028735 RepID=UPI0023F9AF15|nr:tripartite tricarboxylate transporter substrate binding protein [Chelativorans sp. AA-79]WEX08709.1 tripartite tricarboxylate transporter substrate binding protein [Chelativorans sp. AA-79]